MSQRRCSEPAAQEVLRRSRVLVPPVITEVDQKTDRPVPPVSADPTAADAGKVPEWYTLALAELGTREEKGDSSGAAIARYRKLAQCGQDHDPWCAIFANAMFALCKSPGCAGYQVGIVSLNCFAPIQISSSLMDRRRARSWYFGAIVHDQDWGMLGFIAVKRLNRFMCFGGNEDDMVQIEPLSKNQLRGYWWPTSAPKPAIGKIVVPPGTPKHATKVT